MWIFLGVITVILLILHWNRRVVWGGATGGFWMGLIYSFFTGFNWGTVWKGVVIGTLIGFVINLLPSKERY